MHHNNLIYYINFHHKFMPEMEKYDEVFADRPYISGSFNFFGGSIKTEYKNELISFKERPTKRCRCCGKNEDANEHFSGEYFYPVNQLGMKFKKGKKL